MRPNSFSSANTIAAFDFVLVVSVRSTCGWRLAFQTEMVLVYPSRSACANIGKIFAKNKYLLIIRLATPNI